MMGKGRDVFCLIPYLILNLRILPYHVIYLSYPMRVISGKFKGRTLFAPKGHGLRPTSDQVKETLFNMMAQDIPHAIFLDLFAGTGNIGIEALSRGAKQVVFVEKNRAYLRVLQRNLAMCAAESKSVIYYGDANKIVKILHKEAWCFDVIFLDPPYHQTNMLRDLLMRIVDLPLVALTGLIAAEHGHTFMPPIELGNGFFLRTTRRIGDTGLSFYRTTMNTPELM